MPANKPKCPKCGFHLWLEEVRSGDDCRVGCWKCGFRVYGTRRVRDLLSSQGILQESAYTHTGVDEPRGKRLRE